MSTFQDLRTVRARIGSFTTMIERDAQTRREIAYFKANIGKVTTADALLKDTKLYHFMMEAFGLESQIFAKALMRKVLSEGVTDEDAMANKMTDPKFKEIATICGFKEAGGTSLKSPVVVQAIVDRLVRTRLEVKQGEQNEAVRLALYFERKAPSVSNWYQVLGDKAMAEVALTALGIPREMLASDIDKIKAKLEAKFDIKDFKDPAKLETFIGRFAAMSDLGKGLSGTSAPAVPQITLSRRASVVAIDPSITLALLKVPRF
ncbi:DUF1217 domain-containing protein [Arenibaculum pallidiluteum]|uniref:DUF1217 domain-containing protein n=1 Tax=Arenibaculum pallidiluteum TaxID=2812559 RepID=UPI001A97CB1F|nr:DUF1217 domain-containing protein [Arenibaculum pallidiluteum]